MLLLLKSYVVLRALWKIDVYLIGTLVNKVFINILMPQWINNIGVFNFFLLSQTFKKLSCCERSTFYKQAR